MSARRLDDLVWALGLEENGRGGVSWICAGLGATHLEASERRWPVALRAEQLAGSHPRRAPTREACDRVPVPP